MAKRVACPELREPRRRSPDKVNWPPQFVSANGNGELLLAGALEPDEAPFGSATCRLCGEGHLGRAPTGTAAPHVLERRHKERCEKAREDYLAFWQDLACPDERPYYYDHVSHTWTFARPPCLAVLAGVSSEADLEFGGPDDEELQARLAQALVSAFGSGSGTRTPMQASTTPATTSFGQQGGHHMQAHGDMDARAARSSAAGTMQAAAASVARLDPEADVERADAKGSIYWYNPRTCARSWKREDLVAQNTAFYSEVVPRWPGPQQEAKGPHGEEYWWEWQPTDGRPQQQAWTLVELFKKFEENTLAAETQ
mmetsp:Transcript_3514/g.6736  ORF Transcript_3514/g.6736 Transcript_3514/m.6736 type:complete len:312 (-) Transcript_3514:9-944(-)